MIDLYYHPRLSARGAARHRLRLRGVKTPAALVELFHSDYQWRKTRNAFIELEPVCQMCARDNELHVHHILPWHRRPELRYEHQNLLTLCADCHLRFGHYNNWKDFNPDITQLVAEVQALHRDPVRWSVFERDPDWVRARLSETAGHA